MSNNKYVSSDLTKKIFSVFLDFEADCPLVDKRMEVERRRIPRGMCHSGLQLRVSGYARKVREAVTLVLIVEKMKRPKGSLMKHVMEDQAVLEVPLDSDSSLDWDRPWYLDILWNSDNSQKWDNSWYLDILWYSARSWYVDLSWYPDSTPFPGTSPDSSREDLSQSFIAKPHEIYDVQNKYWLLQHWNSLPTTLTATMLPYADMSKQVTLLISTYIPQSNPGSGQLVVLGIKGSNYFLSCSGPSNSPALKLETVEDPAKSLKTISTSSEAARFLFYKQDSGSTSTFESALFPGWFISNDRNKDISTAAMCNGTAATGRVTLFHLSSITNSMKKPSAGQRQKFFLSQRLQFRHLRRKTPQFRLCF
ncbi:hypothetical protein AOXY_G28852 [Acipenser oxyrinchus oxyrinchus]|uniref:Interleukin-1 n=1 Tax=Acipenser oxyrinchus oxyrinchus TaxID=40147 RepID=A0AAD8CP34_ACIOX|nr:hypothetical protein AOXY_G28852 [Acipenser oxyrinchus oxyrinchus]